MRGPNIEPPPEAPELPDSLECTVTIVVEDDISTGDLAPDGVEVMSFRSNVPEIAKFTFRRFDPEYHGKAKESAPGFIVGGHNYGRGVESRARGPGAFAPRHQGRHREELRPHPPQEPDLPGILPFAPRMNRTTTPSSRGGSEAAGDQGPPGERRRRSSTEEGGRRSNAPRRVLAAERDILLAGGILRQLREESEDEQPGRRTVSREKPSADR